jgi:5-methylcytosine-specific restriction endonuclease McrA
MAQFGSALRSGRRGHRFKSCCPDQAVVHVSPNDMAVTAARQEYLRNYQNAWMQRRRLRAINLLGGQCAECSSTEDLQVDHVDPHSKDPLLRALKTASFWSWAWHRIEAELAKCQVLCRSCHKAKSAGESPRGEQHGLHVLTTGQVRDIRRRVLAGESQVSVGHLYGVGRKHVWDLVHRRTRKYE